MIILVAVGAQAALEPPPIEQRWILIVASAGGVICQVCLCTLLWHGSSLLCDGRGCIAAAVALGGVGNELVVATSSVVVVVSLGSDKR